MSTSFSSYIFYVFFPVILVFVYVFSAIITFSQYAYMAITFTYYFFIYLHFQSKNSKIDCRQGQLRINKLHLI